jgi:acetyl esterase/lipase
MMFGDRFHLIDFPLSIALECDAVVIIPEYRLIPEHRCPAAVEDSYSALKWTFSQSKNLGIDEKRIMVGGLSGGGAIAAGLTLMWRDHNGPELCGQFLSTPMLDHRGNTLSIRQYDDANITATALRKAWVFALGPDHLTDHNVSIYASPSIADNLAGVPRAFIDVGSAECFRDECVAYAVKLWEGGVQCELHVWEGGFHGFEEFVPENELSVKSRRARLEWVKKVFET